MKLVHLLSMLPLTTQAATFVSDLQVVNTAIPDNNPIGLTVNIPVSTSITSIEQVKVDIEMSGGWSGDIYCYMIHSSGFAVLLNRIGRSLSVPDGAGNNHLLLTLYDGAAADIHTDIPSSGSVTGNYQPDGRNVSPASSLDTSPRTANFSVFNGLNANGDWTFFVADVASGETMTLNTLSLTVIGVPEPSVALLGAMGCALTLRRRRKAL